MPVRDIGGVRAWLCAAEGPLLAEDRNLSESMFGQEPF